MLISGCQQPRVLLAALGKEWEPARIGPRLRGGAGLSLSQLGPQRAFSC